MKLILDYTIEELQSILKTMGQPAFRAKQIFKWLYTGIKDFDEMSNLPKDLRSLLKEEYYIKGVSSIEKLPSKQDETVKYLFTLNDGNIVEGVLMSYKHGLSVCLSTQVGCRMGCSFCASSKTGLVRNLTAGEMISQILCIQEDAGQRIGNVVLMGIGEPFDNYDNVIKFLKLVNHVDGLNIGMRKISVSTCGLVDKINDFIKENMQVNLSISLHAPNNDKRLEIMPIAKSFSIDKLLDTCNIYTRETGRRITFEYSLISGVNDSEADAVELSNRLKGMLCHVNLIPVNEIDDIGYKKSNRQKVESFKDILVKRGINATIRRELGSDINAACGQLRRDKVQ